MDHNPKNCDTCQTHAFKEMSKIFHEGHKEGLVPAVIIFVQPDTGIVSTFTYGIFNSDEIVRKLAEANAAEDLFVRTDEKGN